jgi:hypothetical protein
MSPYRSRSGFHACLSTPPVQVWIYGRTHYCRTRTLPHGRDRAVLLAANQRGYVGPDRPVSHRFREHAYVEVPLP